MIVTPKVTYDDVAEAWWRFIPSEKRHMWSSEDGNLYSYGLLIARVFLFHGISQVFVLKTPPTNTTARHIKAALRVAKQYDSALYRVDDIEKAHEAWINGMFGWVEDQINSRVKVFSGSGVDVKRVMNTPIIQLKHEAQE